MIKTDLTIRCWNCGNEETLVQALEDNVIDINLDKLCPRCNRGWMIKKELTLQKCLIEIQPFGLTTGSAPSVPDKPAESSALAIENPRML